MIIRKAPGECKIISSQDSDFNYICKVPVIIKVFSRISDGNESACNAGDEGLIPGLGRFPGEENGYPLQYSCLENSTDREAWWATPGESMESQRVRHD